MSCTCIIHPLFITLDSAIADDVPSTTTATIVVTVQEEKTMSGAKRPRVDDAVHIKAQAEALAKASDHFRDIIHRGAAEGGTATTIHVEVSTWKELEALHRILRVAQEEGGGYCFKAGVQMGMDDLLSIPAMFTPIRT